MPQPFLDVIIILIIGGFGMANILHNVDYAPNNLAIMNVESNIGNKHEESFYYKNGESTQTFRVSSDSQQCLTGEVYVKQGSIAINIEDDKGSSIFSQEFTPQKEPYTVQISLDKSNTTYKAHITYNKARGSVNLKPE